MDLGLTGKVALVGGASKGLGRAAAMSLAREGARLVIAARDSQTLEATAEEIKLTTQAEVVAIGTDLSRPDQVQRLIDAALSAFGKVDILVNNAGGPPSGTFLDFSDLDWEAAFRLNLMSAVILAREVIPGMKERRWGRIINSTSIAVKQPLDGLILSNAIRAGVHGWAKSLSNELAPFNITVNNVLPGYIMTDRVRQLARIKGSGQGIPVEQVISDWAGAIPMKRLGQPGELGDLIAFLASERAAYITGVSIPVDGGFYKGLM